VKLLIEPSGARASFLFTRFYTTAGTSLSRSDGWIQITYTAAPAKFLHAAIRGTGSMRQTTSVLARLLAEQCPFNELSFGKIVVHHGLWQQAPPWRSRMRGHLFSMRILANLNACSVLLEHPQHPAHHLLFGYGNCGTSPSLRFAGLIQMPQVEQDWMGKCSRRKPSSS